MDVDMMKSSPTGEEQMDMMKSSPTGEEQMDMMTMMMQIEKLPDFCEPFHYTSASSSSSSALQDIQLSTGNPTSIITTPPIYQNHPHQSSPGLVNGLTPTMPLIGTPIQEPGTTTIQSNAPPNYSTANTFLASLDRKNSTAAIREMIFRIAAMQPIHIDPESIKPPKRRNVKTSKDPQSVAARHRRERISERIRILQRLVPGGTKMDTASMLDEAIHYLKFLKKQVQTLEHAGANGPMSGFGFSGLTVPNTAYSSFVKNCAEPAANMVGSLQMLR